MQWVHKPGTLGPIGSAVSTFTALLLATGCGSALAAPFTPGNYVAYRVGDGSTAPSKAVPTKAIGRHSRKGTPARCISSTVM